MQTSLERLRRSTPEEQGIPSEAINRFLDEVEGRSLELHSLMLLRNGLAVAEGWWAPYRPSDRHLLFSLSKSFTSTAIGFARSEGLLTLEDPIIDYFPDELPEVVSPLLSRMKIKDLLIMASGHSQDTFNSLWKQEDGNWAKAFLSADLDHEPGTRFVYNSGATYMLAALLHKVTGQFLLDYLEPRLLEPLGITDAVWEKCPRGIAAGGWGLSLTTEDIAAFGQLYLQKGAWNGRQLLPEGWVEEASSVHISNGDGGESDWSQGYGYQFWRCRHGAYRGDGAFGQCCVVMPEQDVVLAITACTNGLQDVLNAAWTHLLPAMKKTELPNNPEAAEALTRRLGELRMPPPQRETSSPNEGRLEGRTYLMEPNSEGFQSVSFSFADDGADLTVRTAKGDHRVFLGRSEWRINQVQLNPDRPESVAGSFTWIGPLTLQVTIQLLEAPFRQTSTYRLDPDVDELELLVEINVGPKPQTFRGKPA